MIVSSRTGLLVLLLWSVAAFSAERPVFGVERCLKIAKNVRPLRPVSSFVEDDRNFFAVDGVEFGEYLDGQAFVSYHGQTAKLSERHFLLPDGSSKKMGADVMAMRLATIYSRRDGGTTVFCIAAPASGLGSSGSFQNFVYLLEFDASTPLRSERGLRAALVRNPWRSKK